MREDRHVSKKAPLFVEGAFGADEGDCPYNRYGENYFSGRLLELAVIEFCVEAALVHQLVVRAALDDVAALHDKDQVGIFDRREAVRDDEARAVKISSMKQPSNPD